MDTAIFVLSILGWTFLYSGMIQLRDNQRELVKRIQELEKK